LARCTANCGVGTNEVLSSQEEDLPEMRSEISAGEWKADVVREVSPEKK
jgi:hypothetical protein